MKLRRRDLPNNKCGLSSTRKRGRLVSQPVTLEQQRAVEQAESAPRPPNVVKIHRADGTVVHLLNGAADSVLTATVGADGKIHTQCNDPTHRHGSDKHQLPSEPRDDR